MAAEWPNEPGVFAAALAADRIIEIGADGDYMFAATVRATDSEHVAQRDEEKRASARLRMRKLRDVRAMLREPFAQQFAQQPPPASSPPPPAVLPPETPLITPSPTPTSPTPISAAEKTAAGSSAEGKLDGKKQAKPVGPDYRKLTDFWCEQWAAKHGAKWKFQKGDGAMLAALWDRVEQDLAKATGAIAAYFADSSNIYEGHPLNLFKRDMMKFIARAAGGVPAGQCAPLGSGKTARQSEIERAHAFIDSLPDKYPDRKNGEP